MIAHLIGEITEKFTSSLILDVHGVGYEITVPRPDFEAAEVGKTQKFYTFHNIRENAEELFGFSTLLSKKMFEMIISVSGVGPKAAIAILSLGDAETVRNAIANADSAFISKAAGVGKKSAERIIVDLRDKVGIPSHYGASAPLASAEPQDDEALDALMSLGFPLKEATLALEKIDPSLPVEERLRLALKQK